MRDDYDLLFGDAANLANYLGVTMQTVKRWKAGKVPLPEPCRRLLALRFEGDAAALLGSGWEGFYFQQGELYIPGWKYGFNPSQVKGMFFQVQQVRALQNELATVKTDLLGREFVRRLVRIGADLPAKPVGLNVGNQGDHAYDADE